MYKIYNIWCFVKCFVVDVFSITLTHKFVFWFDIKKFLIYVPYFVRIIFVFINRSHNKWWRLIDILQISKNMESTYFVSFNYVSIKRLSSTVWGKTGFPLNTEGQYNLNHDFGLTWWSLPDKWYYLWQRIVLLFTTGPFYWRP